ncbi:hypothetical protein ACFY3G_46960 [Streptomyces phaeochromogenes]|uniref:hypothetical protein n=1 Tax=Streptomyces phaeochromogenes TaxID=1923 RepID=UPI00367934A2
MSATQREVDTQIDVAAMRQDAAVLFDEAAPLIRYEDLQAAEHRYRVNLAWLLREVDVPSSAVRRSPSRRAPRWP